MKQERMNLILAGIFFIAATIFGVTAAFIENPVLTPADYLLRVSAHQLPITIGAFLTMLMAFSCAGVGLALFPIVKKYSVFMAIAIVGFRLMEAVLQIIIGASQVSLSELSRAFIGMSTLDPAYFQTIGATIKAGSDWLSNGAMLLCWCIAAVMYYAIFYRYKLVPRWLSGWGLIGISLTAITAIFITLQIIPASGDLQTAINLPIALQEMVFAIWLIGTGLHWATIEVRPDVHQVSAVS